MTDSNNNASYLPAVRKCKIMLYNLQGKSAVSLPITATHLDRLGIYWKEKLQHFDCSHISISPSLTLRFFFSASSKMITIYSNVAYC